MGCGFDTRMGKMMNERCVQQKAKAEKTDLNESVVYFRANRPDAYGLPIYFPKRPAFSERRKISIIFTGIRLSVFPSEIGRRNFLAVYYDIMGHSQYHTDCAFSGFATPWMILRCKR